MPLGDILGAEWMGKGNRELKEEQLKAEENKAEDFLEDSSPGWSEVDLLS